MQGRINRQPKSRSNNNNAIKFAAQNQPKPKSELSLFCPDEDISNNQNLVFDISRQHPNQTSWNQNNESNQFNFTGNTNKIPQQRVNETQGNTPMQNNNRFEVHESNSKPNNVPQIIAQSQQIQQQMNDDRLTIKIDGNDHLVDSIVQFKKTSLGVSQFRLAMCCHCCKSRLFWYQKPKIDEYGCKSLRELAAQVEDMYLEGVDIQSQKTNEQLDDEFDAPMCNWDADLEFIDLAGGNETVNSSQNHIKQIDNKNIVTSQTASVLLGANYKSQTCIGTVNTNKFAPDVSQKEVQDDFCDSSKLKIEFPNDSIASNKSQVSVHDDEQQHFALNGNETITNACFDLDFIDDASMMEIVAGEDSPNQMVGQSFDTEAHCLSTSAGHQLLTVTKTDTELATVLVTVEEVESQHSPGQMEDHQNFGHNQKSQNLGLTNQATTMIRRGSAGQQNRGKLRAKSKDRQRPNKKRQRNMIQKGEELLEQPIQQHYHMNQLQHNVFVGQVQKPFEIKRQMKVSENDTNLNQSDQNKQINFANNQSVGQFEFNFKQVQKNNNLHQANNIQLNQKGGFQFKYEK